MSQFLDEWVHTDTGKTILYTVSLSDGTTPDYTSATAISLVARCARGRKEFTLAGTVSSGPNRIFAFPSPITATGLVLPEAGDSDTYDFRVTYTLSGNVYWTSPGRLRIVRFP